MPPPAVAAFLALCIVLSAAGRVSAADVVAPGPTPTPPEYFPLFRDLCATQEMVDRVAALTGLPTGPPPALVVVDADESGVGRAGWLLAAEDGANAVVLVRPWIHVCPHEVAHHLQWLAGARRNTPGLERQAIQVQRVYWRVHGPWDE